MESQKGASKGLRKLSHYAEAKGVFAHVEVIPKNYSILDTLKADKGCFLAALVGLLYILHKFCHHFATKM